MNIASPVYPSMPLNVDKKVIEPSSEFKSEVVKVTLGLVLFVLIYLALTAAAVFLSVLSMLGGVALIAAKPSFITLMLGLGLIGLGVMVVFFLFKFIFTSHKVERRGLIEVKESDQPELFNFIRKITEETKTPFPKRIYLSHDVNASVFYDSSLLSMFFPVKKNLQIGLGLVNSINVSEFKAILAHEFGHFSQRSMKLGSYVYNFNKVIYNLLYDNTGYARLLERWGNISNYFTIFALITSKIIEGIQYVLRQMYTLINKSYMGLSRQMEFHADTVAACVAGSAPLISSLRRIEAAEICYNQLFDNYNVWVEKNLKADNLYLHHHEVMHHFASDFKIPVEHGLMQISAHSLQFFNTSRIIIKDQWSSHPTTDDREAHLRSLNIHGEIVHLPAWSVFTNAEELQKQMTATIYDKVEFKETPTILSAQEFKSLYFKEFEENSFKKAYNGLYDHGLITPLPLDELKNEPIPDYSFEEIFSDSNKNLPNHLNGIKNDLDLVDKIYHREYNVKSFDFEGNKYQWDESYLVQSQLEAELNQVQKQIKENYKKAFQFFYKKALEKNQGDSFIAQYQRLFRIQKESELDGEKYNEVMQELAPIFEAPVSIEIAESTAGNVRLKEIGIKARIREILKDDTFAPFYKEEEKQKLENYLSKDRSYFVNPNFLDHELIELSDSMHLFIHIVSTRHFKLKKELLENQLMLLN